MTHSRITAALVAASTLALSGCITMDNRVACTVAKDRALAIVGIGSVKIGLDVNDLDRKAICVEKAAVVPASAASGAK